MLWIYQSSPWSLDNIVDKLKRNDDYNVVIGYKISPEVRQYATEPHGFIVS